MKRGDLERHLRGHGCYLKREGSSPSLWANPATGAVQVVPRHTEVSSEGGAGDAIDGIFSDVPRERLRAARRTWAYLLGGADARALITRARRHLAHNVAGSHDHKFAEAAFENAAHVGDEAWRARLLAASMAYRPAGPVPARPNAAVREAVERLRR